MSNNQTLASVNKPKNFLNHYIDADKSIAGLVRVHQSERSLKVSELSFMEKVSILGKFLNKIFYVDYAQTNISYYAFYQ